MNFVRVNDEYEKFPELKCYQEEVMKIVEWTKQQPHLPNLQEREVLLFFHACHYHTEISKQTIDLHFTCKTHCTEFFSNVDPLRDEIQRAMHCISIVALKRTTPDGIRILIGKFNDCDATKFHFVDTVKLYCLCFELLLAEEGISSGYAMVMDMSGVNLGHVARLGLMTMKKFLFYLQEAVPIRIAGFHYINLVPFVDKILAIVKPFLKEELAKVLYLHSTLDSFYKFVPKEILPVEYGGNEESGEILKENLYKRLVDNREYFLKEEATKQVNENLRPGKPKKNSDLFGTEGNFKQLVID